MTCSDRAPRAGFTLIEIMVVIALIGVMSGLSLTSYLGYVEKARAARAVAEIVSIAKVIDGLTSDDEVAIPDSLADVGVATPNDPWGNPYQYLRIEGMGYTGPVSSLPPVAAQPAGGGGQGGGGPGQGGGSQGPPGGTGGGLPLKPRQDQFLKPVNTDYDLYSMGPDGETHFNMNSLKGRDDIVRALDGSFVGIAELF
jgi:general secretion pathway protein G